MYQAHAPALLSLVLSVIHLSVIVLNIVIIAFIDILIALLSLHKGAIKIPKLYTRAWQWEGPASPQQQ